MDIFAHQTYRGVLHEWLEVNGGKGGRATLAKVARCSPSWISRVLSESVQLTPDQAFAIADHMGMSDTESDFFLLLLEHERAGTQALKKRIHVKLQKIRKESHQLKASVRTDGSVTGDQANLYYSSWMYSAVHVACMIRPFSSEELATKLRLSPASVMKTAKELTTMGLLVSKAGRFAATALNVHLPAESPMAKVGHRNWRSRTVEYLQETGEDGFHYSAIHCLSEKDIARIHKILKDTIVNCRSIIADSPSEELAVFCVDWFGLGARSSDV
jgi:uncharacterized protein (TIGR02147 family)